MSSMGKTPFFSIIIATRNRPELFLIALRSVLEQTFSDREIIVVIDGSTDSNLAQYQTIEKQLSGIVFAELENRPNGHGQSYALNYGVNKSSGRYLCFLDDDDHWTDNYYLENVFQNIKALEKPVDVHYSNQKAVFFDGREQKKSVWIEDLIPRLKPQFKHRGDSYLVDVDFLLSSNGFAHLNCSIVRREFYTLLGGMDESIRYENDRDFYIRSIDSASVILFSTRYVSLHNIPDITKKSNMSTASSEIDKKIYQMRVYDKGISLSKNSSVAAHCYQGKLYELKHAANILAKNGQYKSAAYYAKSALINGFNLRWLAFTLYLIFKAKFKPNTTFKVGSQ